MVIEGISMMEQADRIDVLIVDSDTVSAKVAGKILKKRGFRIIDTVSSSGEALRIVGERMPDLIVIGLEVQGNMDGIELAAEIKSIRDVPVLFTIDDIDMKTFRSVSHLDNFRLIIKPYSRNELHYFVDALIKQKWAVCNI